MAVVDKNQGFLRGIYLNNAYQGSHLRAAKFTIICLLRRAKKGYVNYSLTDLPRVFGSTFWLFSVHVLKIWLLNACGVKVNFF
jgi:hypothetical protein